jgi:uncharacterized protein YjbI with pentapeptide repeats
MYTDMTGAILTGARLNGANLFGADLTGAELTGVSLIGANMADANLNDADLANIWAVNLASCPAFLPTDWACVQNNLIGPMSNLNGAILDGANLSDIDLSGSTLWMIRANSLLGCPAHLPVDYFCFGNAILGPGTYSLNSDLSGADLYNVNLSYAQLGNSQGTSDLSGANLYGANLSHTYLFRVDLSGAILNGADLRETYFYETDFTDAILTGADISSAYQWGSLDVIWNNTICPDGTNSDDNGNTCENHL